MDEESFFRTILYITDYNLTIPFPNYSVLKYDYIRARKILVAICMLWGTR
jgi:hypothetical protein